MSTKTVALEISAYERLAAQKIDGESFTKTVERLLKGHVGLEGTCGAAVKQAARIWGQSSTGRDADLMERLIQEGRKATSWHVDPLR